MVFRLGIFVSLHILTVQARWEFFMLVRIWLDIFFFCDAISALLLTKSTATGNFFVIR